MAISRGEKLRALLDAWVPGTVATSAWLKSMGVSPQHAQQYVSSHWLEPVATGVFRRPSETPTWEGALYSLQTQLDLQVHVGALSALASEGSAHYMRLGRETVFLFSKTGGVLPGWFKTHDWGVDLRHTQTQFLPPHLGVRNTEMGGFRLKASTAERAILECLHLAPKTVDLMETFEVLEGLRTLRPALMQSLLEACASIKVKRLFLFMADKASLPVLSHLTTDALDLGIGDRAIVKGGVYIAKHRLIVPKELAVHE